MPNARAARPRRKTMHGGAALAPTQLCQRILSALEHHSLVGVKDALADGRDAKLQEEYQTTHEALSEAAFAIRKAFKRNPSKHLADMAMASLIMQHDRDEYPDDGNVVTHKRKIDRAVMHAIVTAAGVDPSICCRQRAWSRAEKLLKADQIGTVVWVSCASH